jgi:NlpC/P60 family
MMHRPVLLALALLPLPALALHGQAKPASLARGTSGSPAVSAKLSDVSMPREAIREALGYLGVPYVNGGESRAGLDCSGLVSLVLRDATGVAAPPRGVEALFHAGNEATYPIHLGDLLFFDTETRGAPHSASHVGIYAGNGRFIHAASEGTRTGVIVSLLSSPYYHDRFLGARRVIPWRDPVLDIILTDAAARVTSASPFPSREKMTIRVLNRMTGGGPMDLTVLRNGERVLAARISPGAFGPSEIPLTPEVGVWDVLVNRLFKGRELAHVTFTVEE